MSTGKRVLLTGASGFVASHILKTLLDGGFVPTPNPTYLVLKPCSLQVLGALHSALDIEGQINREAIREQGVSARLRHRRRRHSGSIAGLFGLELDFSEADPPLRRGDVHERPLAPICVLL